MISITTMERTIIAPEFKGGIWHRFFSAATKKDETLVSIYDEKIRYYKLYYPFLEKKQIMGKAYEELGIPHICGDLNRKELHKLFLKERKPQYKLKETYKKYPPLLIENKSRNKGTIKKPINLTTKQIKVNNVHTNIEKSKEDHVFDNLLLNFNSKKRNEGMIHNMNLKQTKSVRFNDGIEVHSVSPSQPQYKLKPLGRLFDEPSAVRTADNNTFHNQPDLEERIEDSDSDFDADTGITSDAEDYDLEEPQQVEDSTKTAEVIEDEKVEQNSLVDTKTKTIYDCSEEDSQSTDHEIHKEGNDLMLRSKIITVVQGKWVRETKQIIGNTLHVKDTIKSNRGSVMEETDDERQEFIMVKNIEYILENIKSLCISNTEHNTSSDTISSKDRLDDDPNMNDEREQLVVGNIRVGEDPNDIEITIHDSNEHKQRISLDKDLSTHLINEKLLTIDNNTLSYEHDICEISNSKEENVGMRIRTKPIKMIDDIIDYINDWNSSNDGSLSSQRSSIKSMHINDSERDKCNKPKEVTEMKSIMVDEGDSEHSFIEEESCLDKEEGNVNDSSEEEKICLNDKNSSSLITVNNNQVSSQSLESDETLKKKSQCIEIIKTEPSSSKMGYETHDYLKNSNMPFSKKDEVSGEREFQINDTFTLIRSMVCNQSTSNPNELYSTFCSLITKPILVDSKHLEDKGNYNQPKSVEVQYSDQENKKMQSRCSVPEQELNIDNSMENKTQGMGKGGKEINEDENMSSNEENVKGNSKISVKQKSLKNSLNRMVSVSMDHFNSSLARKNQDMECGNNASKISIIDKKIFCDESENILDNLETTGIDEGQIVVESESNHTNYLSKVEMWSSHPKKYSGNLTMASQNSSVVASCNTDSLQKKVVDMEDSRKSSDEHNNEFYYNYSSNEDSVISRRSEEDSFEELNDSIIDLEAESSTSVTPVKAERINSEEISTAYETDPETGKLIMNRFLCPITNSTPIKLEQIDQQQDSIAERRLDENELRDQSNYSFYSDEESQIEHETKNKQSTSIPIIDESTIKYSQCRYENVPSELSSHVSQLVKHEKSNEKETTDALCLSETDLNNNKKRYLNEFTESSIEKNSEVLWGTDKPAFEQGNSNKSSSLSIIGNTETDSQRTFEKGKKSDVIKSTTSHLTHSGEREDEFVPEINPSAISIQYNIENSNIVAVSETPESYTDKQRHSNEAMCGSFIQTNELQRSQKEVILNPMSTEKAAGHSNSTDIIYDTSNVTEDNKFGQVTKTSTVGFTTSTEGEYKISETENLINENQLNISHDFIVTANKKRLSAVSESILNNNSKTDDNFILGSSEKVISSNKILYPIQLGAVPSHLMDENSSARSTQNDLKSEGNQMHETFSKRIIRQANVSHVTFLIRDCISTEDRSSIAESDYQQLMNTPQSDKTSVIKKHDRNKEPNINEIISTGTKIHTEEDKNDGHMSESLKVSNSNSLVLDNTGSQFAIGVENSHIESSLLSSNNDKNKYFTRSSSYFSLKRKLEAINENDSGSDTSLSQNESSRKEIKMNVSSNVHSVVARYSESSITTDTSSIEMNLKRVNTDIRRKRAKLKKENPVRKNSTSSSEDEIKKPYLIKGKTLVSSKPLVKKFTGTNSKMIQSNKFDVEENIDSVSMITQQMAGGSQTNLQDKMPGNHSSLTCSIENKVENDSFDEKTLNKQKNSQNNQLSDDSSSIIYSSPNVRTGQQEKISKTNDRPKININNMIKKRYLEETPNFSDSVKSLKKMNEKSHKSYPLYRKYNESDKENPNVRLSNSRLSIKYPKKPLQQSNPGKLSDIALETQKDEVKTPHQSIKKNRKSSIVRLMGTAEASQISNSPEVKGLLRRTYFMGNN